MNKIILSHIAAICFSSMTFANEVEPINSNVYFNTDSSIIQNKWSDLLQSHADYIINNNQRVLIAGFADETGERHYNEWLGLRRAEQICTALYNKGVDKELVTCVSYGENHPSDPGSNSDALTRNRRVQFIY